MNQKHSFLELTTTENEFILINLNHVRYIKKVGEDSQSIVVFKDGIEVSVNERFEEIKDFIEFTHEPSSD